MAKKAIMVIKAPERATKFQTPFKNHPVTGEYSDKPSMTIPDDSYSITELVKRFASGLSVSGQKVPIYHGEEPMPDWNKMDLSEQAELIETTRLFMDEFKKDLKAKQDAYADREREEQIIAAHEKRRRRGLDNSSLSGDVNQVVNDNDEESSRNAK